MDKFIEKWDSLSVKSQKILQVVVGLLLATISGIMLILSSAEGSGYLEYAIALGVPLIIPNMLEKKLDRKFPAMRTSMLLGLVAFVIVFIVQALMNTRA